VRKSFCILFIAILAVCVLLFLVKKRRQGVPLLPTTIAATNYLSNIIPPSQVAQPTTIHIPPREVITNIVNVETSPGKTNPINSYLLSNWQGSINFYGKVIDENSNPVDKANVYFQWNEFPTEDGMRNTNIKSDAQGLFFLVGARGLTLNVSIQKKGYYSSKRDNDSYTFGSLGGAKFSADSQNPVIFHLLKKERGVSLIETKFPPGMRIAQLHHDGTPVILDLISGTQVSNGDGQLELQLWHDISDKNAVKFDWKLQLSTSGGGGLVPTDEEFAFQAPQNGYQPSIIVDMPATNQDWNDSFSARYYIQLPNGDYGRFDLNLLAYNGVFTVTSVINPSGSQNLEPSN
jgi:hypothetical protein